MKSPDHNRTVPRIFCAQPDAAAREFLTQAFDGFDVTFVVNGREALAHLNASCADAYVLDFWLPDWSGVSLCRDIRNMDPHAPIAFCTRARSEDAIKRALRAGADVYLPMPVEAARLRKRVEKLIQSRDETNAAACAAGAEIIRSELQRRAVTLENMTDFNRDSFHDIIERSTRKKALAAFLTANGTRANFERWWPQAYCDALDKAGFVSDDAIPHPRGLRSPSSIPRLGPD